MTRFLIAAALLAGTAEAREQFVYEPERGAQIASLRSERLRGAAVLASLRALPILPQVVVRPGGGGGGITIGTTTITGGATTQVLFNLAGVVSSDSDMTFATDTLTITKIAATTFTGSATFSVGGAQFSNDIRAGFGGAFTEGTLRFTTSQTPDTFAIGTGPTSERIILAQTGDLNVGTDMNNCDAGTSAAVDPGVCVKSAAANTSDYCVLTIHGLSCKYVKALTESVATPVWRIPVAAEEGTGGEFWYTIYATDGSTPQVRQGRVIFSVTADAAVETCVLGTPEETDNTPTGTLTVTVTCNTGPSNAVDLELNAVSSLAQTTLEARSYLLLVGPGLVARQ